MLNKKVLIFVGVFLFFGCRLAYADVVINEVAWMGTTDSQYGEWIEFYNNGSPVDLTNWKLYESGGSVLIFTFSKTIPENGFLVLERTTSSSPDPLPSINDESGLFGGSGLSNSGEFLVLKDSNGIIIDSLDFSSGWTAGDSTTKQTMQKSGSTWITGISTPGITNQDSGNNQDDNNDDENNDEIDTIISPSGSSEKKATDALVFKANILVSTSAFTGKPIEFGLDIKYGNDTYATGKYFWNFGDGVSMEKSGGFEKFTHIYFYPGDYNVSLEYFKNNNSAIPDVIDEIVIKVVPLTVSISKIGDEKDFFIELTNNADFKIDISKWILSSGIKNFIFPKNTVINAKKSIIVSGEVSGFVLDDEKNLKLFSSTGDIIFDYSASLIKPENVKLENKILTKSSTNPNLEKTQVSSEDLQANIINSNIVDNLPIREADSKNSYLFFGLFFILLFGAGIGVYFIRKNKNVLKMKDGEDFEILDE